MKTTHDTIENLISNANLEYMSDISWGYDIETSNYYISFYKDDDGKNHIENFHRNVKGTWFEIIPTDEQLKMMFEKLDNTPYREVEVEHNSDSWGENLYEKYGVSQSNFY